MKAKIREILMDFGLDEKSIEIYITLIKNNEQSALEISRHTGIDRTTVYDVLQKLIHEGIVSVKIVNKSKHFIAFPPNKLLNHYREKYNALESIIPELNKISGQEKETIKCEVLQGKQGIRMLVKDLIDVKKDYKAIGLVHNEIEEVLGYISPHGVKRINELNLKEELIVSKSTPDFEKLKNGVYTYIEHDLTSPVTTITYGDKALFVIWKEPYYAVVIENKSVAETISEYFEIIASTGKKRRRKEKSKK